MRGNQNVNIPIVALRNEKGSYNQGMVRNPT